MSAWIFTTNRADSRLLGVPQKGSLASRADQVFALNAISKSVAVALVLLVVMTASAEDRKTRVYNANAETLWAAALGAANEGFLPDRSFHEKGKLRFRTGPLRAYRFEVVIVPMGPARARLELELRTSREWITKDAWRDGDRYLRMVSLRIKGEARK